MLLKNICIGHITPNNQYITKKFESTTLRGICFSDIPKDVKLRNIQIFASIEQKERGIIPQKTIEFLDEVKYMGIDQYKHLPAITTDTITVQVGIVYHSNPNFKIPVYISCASPSDETHEDTIC